MKEATETQDSDRYIGKPEVCDRLGCDPGTIARRVRAGEFPRPVYVFGRAKWLRSTVQAWESEHVTHQPAPSTRNLKRGKVAP